MPTIQIRSLTDRQIEELKEATSCATASKAIEYAALMFEDHVDKIVRLERDVLNLRDELELLKAERETLRDAAYDILQKIDQKGLL